MRHESQTAVEPAQAQLKEAEFAFDPRVDDAARGVSLLQDEPAQFVAPDRRQGDGQQQAFEAVGMLQAGVIDVKPAGLVVAEALLDLHAQAIFVQALRVGALVGDHGHQFRRVGRIAQRPGDGQVRQELADQGEADVVQA